VTGLVTAFGSGAMTNSIADLSQAKCFLVIGSNTTEQHPVIGTRLRRAVREGAQLILADPRAIDLASISTLHLRHRPGTDIALLNGLAHIILHDELADDAFIANRTENLDAWRAVIETYTPERVSEITGVSVEDLRRAAHLYATNKPAAILYAMGITQHISGHQNVLAVANLALLTGNIGQPGAGVNPLRGQNNVQGACDMGCLPNYYPGYQKVDDPQVREKFEAAWGLKSQVSPKSQASGRRAKSKDDMRHETWDVGLAAKPGLTVVEMMNAAHAGRLQGMVIIGENPAMSDPDAEHVREALSHLDFLVVQDIFLTETAQLADVVLPAASFAEKDGTFTNTERRVQRVRKAVPPPGEARADWEIICELANKLQRVSGGLRGSPRPPETPEVPARPWVYNSPSEIFDEMAALTPSYAGITYERLEQGGIQWPCPRRDHPGTPILHTEKFPRGRGLFNPVEWTPPAEQPDDEYPLTLTTGRLLQHYHTGSMTRRVAGLNVLVPEERVEVNAQDAARLGINDADWIRVVSRRGAVRARAHVGEACPPGTVFMTFHFAEALGNVLTNPALDPVAKIPELKVCAVRVEPVTKT